MEGGGEREGSFDIFFMHLHTFDFFVEGCLFFTLLHLDMNFDLHSTTHQIISVYSLEEVHYQL